MHIGNPFKSVGHALEKVGGVVANIATAGGYEAAKKQKKQQSRAIAEMERQTREAKAKALNERKQRIDQLREQRSGNGTSTKGFSTHGIKSNKEKEKLG